MKEIISVHVGQAGIQLSDYIWQILCIEHGISLQGGRNGKQQYAYGQEESDLFTNYYSQDKDKLYRPRAIHADLQQTAINSLKKGSCRNLFKPSNYAIGKVGSGSNFARGRYMDQTHNLETSMDTIRKQAENCDNLEGFLIFNSIGGGTGSGLGSILLEQLSDTFCGKVKMGFNIFPSKRTSFSCVEPYNTVLALPRILQHQDMSVVLDNQAIEDIGRRNFDLECTPSFETLNNMIGHAVSGITGPTRHYGSDNFTLNTLKDSMVPSEQFRLLVTAASPLVSAQKSCGLHEIDILTEVAFSNSHLMAKCDLRHGQLFACKLMYRGYISQKYIPLAIDNMKKRFPLIFKYRDIAISTHFNPSYSRLMSNSQIRRQMMNCFMLCNSSKIGSLLERFQYQFGQMYSYKAFVHWYIQQGLEEKAFQDATESLQALIGKYQQAEMQLFDQSDS